MAFARIVTHYFAHRAWLEDGQLLRDAYRLAGIPGALVHGRLDLGGPAEAPWRLAQAWPDAQLHLLPGGHTGNKKMTAALLEAAHRFSG
jgi:proline iminopeptidase